MEQCRVPALFLLLVLLSMATDPASARRAVGKYDVMEAEVGPRGTLENDIIDDFWGDDAGTDQASAPAAGITPSTGRLDVDVKAEPPSPTTLWRAGEGGTEECESGDGSRWIEGPVSESVTDRGLVARQTSASSILQEHLAWHRDETVKVFAGETLGYVTPWHGRGYDFARTFRSKFTYISPVWYQLRGQEAGGASAGSVGGDSRKKFTLTGGHDFDGAWVADVRDGVHIDGSSGGAGANGHTTKIVPRVVLEMYGRFQLSGADLLEMSALLVDEAILRRYHGYVLDIPLSDGIEQFVGGIKQVAQQRGVDLLLIQSVRAGSRLSPQQRETLVPLVHRFSLMTYDYGVGVGGEGGGVPNSPLGWMRECAEAFAPGQLGKELRGKILLGLPFYGYDNGKAINYKEALSALQGGMSDPNAVRIRWDMTSREHVITYTGWDAVEHTATYPTLQFIKERTDLAHELGVGIAVWELGQGMPYYFDLL